MTFAVNWDVANDLAWNAATPNQVAEWVHGARYTMRQSNNSRTQWVKDAGLKYMGVYTGQSEGFIDPAADWIQVYNEPQAHDTPAWFVHEYTTIRSHAEDGLGLHPKWAFPGLHRGPDLDLQWLRGVFELLDGNYRPDAIALHLYTHTPQSAQDYCDRVWNEFQIAVICTEWYRAAEEGHHQFQCMLNGSGLDGQGARCGEWNSIMCLSDHMTAYTEGIYLGLLNLDNQPKDEFYSLLSAPEDCRK